MYMVKWNADDEWTTVEAENISDAVRAVVRAESYDFGVSEPSREVYHATVVNADGTPDMTEALSFCVNSHGEMLEEPTRMKQ